MRQSMASRVSAFAPSARPQATPIAAGQGLGISTVTPCREELEQPVQLADIDVGLQTAAGRGTHRMGLGVFVIDLREMRPGRAEQHRGQQEQADGDPPLGSELAQAEPDHRRSNRSAIRVEPL
jgi:hypothetical protein